MVTKNKILNCVNIIGLFFLANCTTQVQNSINEPKRESPILDNCYITKPVKEDSKEISLGDIEFSNLVLEDFLKTNLKKGLNPKIDNSMRFVTSFERQRQIFINNSCIGKLKGGNTDFLMELYYNSGFNTKSFSSSIIEYVGTYQKEIYNLGKCSIYEFRLNGVAEIEPHFMYIILQEQREQDIRFKKDIFGNVIFSDGMNWKNLNGSNESIPLFVHMIRREKEIVAPLYYFDGKFIPIGHFKIGEW